MIENKNFDLIREQINSNDIVLFMKGTSEVPQCGFSATVVAILRKLELTFKDVDVLSSPTLRQAIKEFSDWPTIPQLYIKGEFIGGCDIVRELYESKELEALVKAKLNR